MKQLLFVILGLFCSIHSFSQFSEKKVLTANASGPTSVYSEDLDGDGDMDILSTSSGDDKVAWYENLGGGIFGFQRVISTAADAPFSVYAVDLDGDADIDVLSASLLDDNIAWYENLGGGNFGLIQIISSQVDGANSVYATDLDGDGDQDVISGSVTDDKIAWYENLGSGTFGVQQVISLLVDDPSMVSAADLDGDGDFDVISASEVDDKIAWYENLGSGSFGPQQIISLNVDRPLGLSVGDLDGDGDVDVLSASFYDDKIAWFENSGNGSFSLEHVLSDTVLGAASVQNADFDQDGDLDVIAISISNLEVNVLLFENLGGGTFGVEQDISGVDDNGSRVSVVDLDGDGVKDLLTFAFNSEIGWYQNDGVGNFGARQALVPHTFSPTAVHSNDLDGDGDIDILTGSRLDDKVGWIENMGNDSFAIIHNITLQCDYPFSVSSADFDGDGDIDVVALCGGSDEITLYDNVGGGNFGPPQVIIVPSASKTELIAADIDNDGMPDLIYRATASYTVAWLKNLGGGAFAPPQILGNQLYNPTGLFVSDLDSDGDLDILACYWTGVGTIVSWFENLNSGSFSGELPIASTSLILTQVFAGDLDGNGFNDIVTAAYFYGEIQSYPNSGGGNFGAQQTVSLQIADPRRICVADVDDDGKQDLVVACGNDNKVAWIKNSGGGSFDAPIDIDTTLAFAHLVHVTDIDFDGDIDLISGSKDDNTFAWHTNYTYHNTQIRGSLFIDNNQNGLHDSLDVGVSQLGVFSTPQSDYTYTDLFGNYFMIFSDTLGSYVVEPQLPTYWEIVTDSLSYTVMIDSNFVLMDSLDFGIYPDTTVHQMNTELVGGFPRCNTTINYWIELANTGSTTPSVTVDLLLHNSLTYIGADLAPDSIVGQHIYWSIDSIDYFTHEHINLQVNTPDWSFTGDIMTSYLSVSALDSVGNVEYNVLDYVTQVLVCSFDPNDKTANPVGVDSMGYISPTTTSLEYLVRFQNTGNDTALNVVIRDQLDPNLYWPSFVPLASSHAVQITGDQNGEVVFSFLNIMLPDSNVDELGSQGFIKYSIDIDAGTTVGTSIYNTADIYFDSNPPVVTNTKINTLYDCEIVHFSMPVVSACFNEVISGSVVDTIGMTDFTWDLLGISSQVGPAFTWQADTAGTFSLQITAANELCSKDTILQVFVESDYSALIIDTTLICVGDSVFIFGQYQSQAGSFSDSLQSLAGCDSIQIRIIEVTSVPVVLLDEFAEDTICLSSTLINLPAATPAGGSYAGNGVVGNDFDPSNAGAGTHIIYYIFTDINFCTATDSVAVTVESDYSAVIIDTTMICGGDSALIFGQYQSQAGSYSDLLLSLAGCDSVPIKVLEVAALPVVAMLEFAEDTVCLSSAIVGLPSGTPIGGSYSGNGVIGNEFDPAIAGEGAHPIYYTFVDGNMCSATDSVSITVLICDGISGFDPVVVTLHPNPFSDYTTLSFGQPLNGDYSVKIHDIVGKEVYSKGNITGTELRISQENWGPGVLVLTLTNDRSGKVEFSTKVIVE